MQTNELEIKVSKLADMEEASKQLLAFFDDFKIVLLEAPMGAGKTTLIKEICKTLGSIDHLSSPTYSIVNEYDYPKGKIYHFDLYRLKNEEELYDMGVEEYLQSHQFCFVEWPDKMIDIIDSKYVKIEIRLEGNIRYIRASKIKV